MSEPHMVQNDRSRMLNRLKKETASRILGEIPADAPVRKSVIDESNVPESMRQFLVRMLDRRIELTLQESFDSAGAWFDSTSGVARDLLAELLDTARESARFPEDQWMEAVRRATDMVVRYSVKPVDTLVLFAFGVDGESIRSRDLRRCVRFFKDHRPIRRAVIHFLDGHPTDPVARADFEEGLRHFHDRLTSEYSADQWIDALDPLQDLTTYSGLKLESVPVEGAVLLYRNLGLERLADRIEEEATRREAVFVKRKTLEQLVKSELSIEAAWSAAADESPEHGSNDTSATKSDGSDYSAAESATKESSGADATETVSNGPESPGSSEWAPKPGWNPSIVANNDATTTEEKDSSDTESAASAEAPGKDDVPLWKQYQPDAPRSRAAELENDAAPLWKTYREKNETTGARIASDVPVSTTTAGGGVLEDLETTLLGNRSDRRSRYVRVLFKGDADAYAETLAMISEVSSWEQASKILSRRVFKRYDVDIYGDAAVEFTDALEQSFND